MRKTLIITDPIHQVMNLGSDPTLQKCFTDVVDTRAFQRLRRITQLGLASYVFPGATHTRFCHGLGAAYLAHSVLTHLREWAADPADKEEINEVFNSVVIAALLHDVGHGPFSHAFEGILKGHPCETKHEEWTATFITHGNSEIRQQLTNNGIDVAKVSSIFTKTTESCLPRPYQQIVSSQLDVDRMDYLVRDSHFAGVAIGRFDVHYLIHSIVVVSHDQKDTKTLGITPKGVKAYEAFLLARQLMNRTVYYHHKVKVLEFMMEHFLRSVIQHMDEVSKISSVAPFIPPYLKRVAAAVTQGRGKDILLSDGYEDYVRLTEDSIWSLVSVVADSSAAASMRNMALKLLRREILPHWAVRVGKGKLLRETLLRDGLSEDRDFHLLDLKTVMYKADGDERVFVVDWQGKIEEVGEHSDTISTFRDRPEAESLLIAIDTGKESHIKDLARGGQFIVVR
jgi:uncharacterized protein